jgi:two-component system response regulator RegX3
VLVVEDEESISDPLSYLLRQEGFEVAVAATGPDGLAEFDRSGADIVLLDLMLPGLSGTEVCRALRAKSSVPVIMLTARDSEIDKVVGLELGADDYVTKPFSSRELVARVRAVLRRRGGEAEEAETGALEAGPVLRRRGTEPEEPTQAALEAGPVRMDVERHVVTVSGRHVPLPLKEFELLELLLRNAGRVLTRSQLIDRVWGADYVGDTKTLDVHVKRLRAKIEPDPGTPQDGADAPLAQRAEPGELGVGRRAEQGGELGAVGQVQRLGADVGVRRRGAPPVQVGAARPPGPAVELPDRGDEDLDLVRAGHPLLGAAHRQLPADVRLGLQRVHPEPVGEGVQRAARAAREAGAVEEDARAVDGAGAPGGLALELVELGDALLAAEHRVLPPLLLQRPGDALDALLVLLVGVEGAVAAAPVVGPALDDALAAAAVDARPRRQQPGEVAAHDALRVGRVDELHPVPGEAGPHLRHAQVRHSTRLTAPAAPASPRRPRGRPRARRAGAR